MTKNSKIEFETKLVDKSKKHTIFIGDALEILDSIKGTPFKLIFADPPYNMGKKFGNNNDKWSKPEDYRDWCISWIKKCIDKLADDGSIMIMGHPRYSSYLIPFLDKNLIYANQIIYYYTDGMPERKNFERRYEVILYYRKNAEKFIFNLEDVRVPLVRYDKTSNPEGKNPNDVWQIHRVRWNSKERASLDNGKIAHAAQKPIRLLRRAILATTNKDDIILDPFLGTGTTSVAAKELNRKSIGIEMNPHYAQVALERINNTKKIKGEIDSEQR
ncbi:MAG: adenine-specific DNA-methyltransferase [Bacteroidetes bacterium]|nr:adenine-specific DNA-methyltransferase [Bacteroidota bacterium]